LTAERVASKFRLIVFDLDGTLVDSRKDIADSANETLVSYGAQPLAEDAIGRMVGDGAPTLIARAFGAAGRAQPSGALDRFLSIYNGRLLDCTRPYAGIPELLADLESRTTLAVLTNKPLAATRRILAGLDLARRFEPDRIVGGDGPFPRKPDPTGLEHLIASAGAAADATVLVGDSVVDWRTASAAATKVCLARYGFGWEGFPIDQLGADAWVVDSPDEMRRYL
jgi:phosphoglycolate phosphatase